MSMSKNRILFWLWLLISLFLWVFDFRIISFILLVTGWIMLVKDDPIGKGIRKTLLAGFLFIMFWVVSQFLIFELKTDFAQPCWSPDGKQIAFFMHKRLERQRPGMMGWIGTNIWDKYYLCAMDYDGGNFKVVKDTENMGRVLWPISDSIVYSEEKHGGTVINGKVNNTVDAIAYKIHPDGIGLEELWRWNEKSEYRDVYWVTPKEDYIVLFKNTEAAWGYAVYDRRKQQIKKEFLYSHVNLDFYGSYNNNKIAFIMEKVGSKAKTRTLVNYNIDTDKEEKQEIPALGNPIQYFDGFEYRFASRSYSPDRSMYAEGGPNIWSKDDKLIGYVKEYYPNKPKRSYLFNIFGK